MYGNLPVTPNNLNRSLPQKPQSGRLKNPPMRFGNEDKTVFIAAGHFRPSDLEIIKQKGNLRHVEMNLSKWLITSYDVIHSIGDTNRKVFRNVAWHSSLSVTQCPENEMLKSPSKKHLFIQLKFDWTFDEVYGLIAYRYERKTLECSLL